MEGAGRLIGMQASLPVQVQLETWEAAVAVERWQAGREDCGKCESAGGQGTVGQPLPWQQQGEEGKVPAVWADEPVAVSMVCALKLFYGHQLWTRV